MRTLIVFLLTLVCLFAQPVAGQAAWYVAGPGAMLNSLADALEKKDLSRLREMIDAESWNYAGRIVKTPGFPRTDPLEHLSRANFRFSIFGDSTLEGFHRVEELLFERLGNGLEQDECREERRPGCPWIPEAVGKAVRIEESKDDAIYAVDNKHGIRTWLLLKRDSDRWRVWAVAETDKDARLIAGREFQDTLARVRKELPPLLAARDKADAARKQARDEKNKKIAAADKLRAAASEQRKEAEFLKNIRDAVRCRLLDIVPEKSVDAVPPSALVLRLELNVHNRNRFAVFPQTWGLTFSRPDGTQDGAQNGAQDGAQMKTVKMDHPDGLPLLESEEKTLVLVTPPLGEGFIDCLTGWREGTYAARVELLDFERQE
jgi:hypothetical protein